MYIFLHIYENYFTSNKYSSFKFFDGGIAVLKNIFPVVKKSILWTAFHIHVRESNMYTMNFVSFWKIFQQLLIFSQKKKKMSVESSSLILFIDLSVFDSMKIRKIKYQVYTLQQTRFILDIFTFNLKTFLFYMRIKPSFQAHL